MERSVGFKTPLKWNFRHLILMSKTKCLGVFSYYVWITLLLKVGPCNSFCIAWEIQAEEGWLAFIPFSAGGHPKANWLVCNLLSFQEHFLQKHILWSAPVKLYKRISTETQPNSCICKYTLEQNVYFLPTGTTSATGTRWAKSPSGLQTTANSQLCCWLFL